MTNKLKLEIFSKNEEKQYVYLRHLALAYRAKLPLLSELFQIPEDELYKKLFDYNSNSPRALIYLFHHDLTDQETARMDIVTFYNSLLNALINKDKAEQHRLVSQISDADAERVLKKSNSGEQLSDEDILIIMRHQLKYGMSYRAIASFFNQHRPSMCVRMQRLMENNPELQSKYERLTAFSEDMWVIKRK